MQDKGIRELIEKIKKYANDVDVSLVEKAYYFGKKHMMDNLENQENLILYIL